MMTAICKGEPASLDILIFFSSPLERVNLEALLVAPQTGWGVCGLLPPPEPPEDPGETGKYFIH